MKLTFAFSVVMCSVLLSMSQAQSLWDRIQGFINFSTYSTVSLVLSTIEINYSMKRIVRIECHNSKTKRNNLITSVDDPDIPTKLDLNQKVGFIIHGWNTTYDSQYILDIYSAWAENRPENICRIDWSPLSNVDYETATRTNYIDAARYIALFIRALNENYNVRYEDVIVVGFSMGAQVAGVIGHELNSRLGLIIGLDPAGRNFNYPFKRRKEERLDEDDAIMVQAIHASYLILGSGANVGQQNIFLNSGIAPQPGCLYPNLVDAVYRDFVACSHFRAPQLFEESLRNGKNCIAIQCDNLLQYLLKRCHNTYEYLGLDSKGVPGNYYLTTDTSPTCIGNVYND